MKNLETERLLLTPWKAEDAEDLYAYAKNPNVGPHAGWAPHKDVAESREIIVNLFMPAEAWEIRDKGTGKVIGTIALEADKHRPDTKSKEIGYSLAEECWGKGIMTEATGEVLRFSFEELGLDIVGICTSPVNIRSQRVIEKCGFKYEGTIRRTYLTYDGTIRDSRCYSMLKEEWEKLNK
ncbi:MAG: GNAT family protein [Anaerovoracaceae bacterium]